MSLFIDCIFPSIPIQCVYIQLLHFLLLGVEFSIFTEFTDHNKRDSQENDAACNPAQFYLIDNSLAVYCLLS